MQDISKGALRDFETGTGGAYAPLSGSQKPSPTARDARFVRMTDELHIRWNHPRNLTPNPFPSGKGNRMWGFRSGKAAVTIL